jgi:dihydroflavonol-4-reductase
MGKTLVTGATGFVGASLVRKLLDDGQQVRVTVRDGSDDRNLKGLDIERVNADLRDAAAIDRAVRGCDVVYHAAAKVAFWVPIKDRQVFYDVNVVGTRNVLSATLQRGVSKVVYTSSVSAIGCQDDGRPTTEEDYYSLWDKGTDYEHSKFAAEFEVWRFAARGLPVVAVLPTAPVGWMDRSPNPVGRVVLDFLARKLPAVDGGINLIDVDDVAAGHLLAAKHGRVGERYILGHQNLTMAQVFGALEQVSGVAAPRMKAPYRLALGAAHVLQFVADYVTNKHPLFTPAMVKMAALNYYVDTSKAERELGFKPRSTPAQGAARAIRWFLDNGYVRLGDKQRQGIRSHLEAAAAGV